MRARMLALTLAALITGCWGNGAKQHSNFGAAATADLQAIKHGDCNYVTQHFDPLMAALSATSLCANFRSYSEAYGGLKSEDAASSTRRGQLTVVRIPLHLRDAAGEYRETYHPDGTVAGPYFLKPGVPLP
ncbi:MAG: hypothetical protein ABR549_12425 [Mycobacteriales bacterium]